jgi:hypothetical protein
MDHYSLAVILDPVTDRDHQGRRNLAAFNDQAPNLGYSQSFLSDCHKKVKVCFPPRYILWMTPRNLVFDMVVPVEYTKPKVHVTGRYIIRFLHGLTQM